MRPTPLPLAPCRSRGHRTGPPSPHHLTARARATGTSRRGLPHCSAVNYPLTIRPRDGTLTEVLYNASVYPDAAGNVLGVFAAARDVTAQNQAQREVAAQQALEKDRLAELETFHRLTVGRELHMIELQKEIEYLKRNMPPTAPERSDER